jgi:hypothetical protein
LRTLSSWRSTAQTIRAVTINSRAAAPTSIRRRLGVVRTGRKAPPTGGKRSRSVRHAGHQPMNSFTGL